MHCNVCCIPARSACHPGELPQWLRPTSVHWKARPSLSVSWSFTDMTPSAACLEPMAQAVGWPEALPNPATSTQKGLLASCQQQIAHLWIHAVQKFPAGLGQRLFQCNRAAVRLLGGCRPGRDSPRADRHLLQVCLNRACLQTGHLVKAYLPNRTLGPCLLDIRPTGRRHFKTAHLNALSKRPNRTGMGLARWRSGPP